MSTSQKILIIGAGLGGLALAQSLRKQHIDFEIFDRDTNEGARFQGWGISLHGWFMEELSAAMPGDMPDLKPVESTYDLGIPSSAVIVNAHDMSEEIRMGAGSKIPLLRADRAKLRDWLLTKLHVGWNKRFTHYEQDDNGVTAFFDDGSSAHGTVLVGADGISSHVRSQLLAGTNLGPRHLPQGIIGGELTVDEEQYKRWMQIASTFFIGFAGSRRLFVGLKGITSEKRAHYYWMYGWPDEAAQDPDFWTHTASKQQLYDYVMNTGLEGIHDDLAQVIRATPVEGMLHPPLQVRDMLPPELPKGRVTLLGDAVHPMAPFRGEGGNMAMADGFRMAQVLASAAGRDISDALKTYEAEMRERTTKSVANSRAAADPRHADAQPTRAGSTESRSAID